MSRLRCIARLVLCMSGAIAAGCAAAVVPKQPVAYCDLAPAPPLLVYPAPQSASADPGVGMLLVDRASTAEALTLTTAAGQQIVAGSLGPAPSPLPPGVPPGNYMAASLPTLASATTYNVNAIVPYVCLPSAYTATIGSFSTR